MKPLLLFAILIALLASCRSPQVITERIVTDTTIIREIPKIITLPGQTIQSPGINIDSLVRLIQSGISHETISQTLIQEDPETKLRVGIMLDALGNLTAVCEQQERTIELMEREIERLRTETVTTNTTEKPSFWQTIKAAFYLIFFAVISTVIITLILQYRARSS